ncbi:MAG: hypothetical protein WCO14_01210 [bacterium]
MVSILIALAAVTAALVSWTAAQVNSRAGTLDGAATQAALDAASTRITIATDLTSNLFYYDQYFQHLKTAELLDAQTTGSPTDLAAILWDERLRELNQASYNQKNIEQDFLLRGETVDSFQAEEYQRARLAEAASQRDLDWALSLNQAQDVRALTLRLVSLNLFFTAAIFFFIIGLNAENRRLLWAAGGVCFYAAGLSLFVLWMV